MSCKHNKIVGSCDFCKLEDIEYYGCDQTTYNKTYQILYDETLNSDISIIITRYHFHHFSGFSRYYDMAKIALRKEKIKSLY